MQVYANYQHKTKESKTLRLTYAELHVYYTIVYYSILHCAIVYHITVSPQQEAMWLIGERRN